MPAQSRYRGVPVVIDRVPDGRRVSRSFPSRRPHTGERRRQDGELNDAEEKEKQERRDDGVFDERRSCFILAFVPTPHRLLLIWTAPVGKPLVHALVFLSAVAPSA
jgi:hypothetical protein